MLAEVEDNEQIRMVERSSGASLLLEAAQAIGIIRQRLRQDLDGHFAADARIAGAVDLTHAAGAEGGDDLVGTEA